MQPFPQLMLENGLSDEADERSVKRAYAVALRKIDQAADPAGFQSLRESYDYALTWLRHRDWHKAQQESAIVAGPTDGVMDQLIPEVPKINEQPTVQTVVSEKTNSKDELNDISYNVNPQVDGEKLAGPALGLLVTSPHDDAQAVFSILLERIREHSNPTLTELHIALEDPRLFQIEARDIFEWIVASYLASGWREENRDLMSAAISHFQWDKDSQRLMRFGKLGQFIDQAMNEKSAIEQLDMRTLNYQVQIIQRLRIDTRPSDQYLIINMYLLEIMARQFPAWLSMMTSRKNIEQWREWASGLDCNQELPKELQAKKPRFHFNHGVNSGLIGLVIWALIQFALHAGTIFSSHEDHVPTHNISNFGPQPVPVILEPRTPKEMFNLGEDYLFGRDRLQVDVNKTLHYWTMAADQGDTEAQLRLGTLYLEGKVVPKNYDLSLHWFQMAANQGNSAARNYVGWLKSHPQPNEK